MTIRIGISGWTYPPWRGVFYPKCLAQKNELGPKPIKWVANQVVSRFSPLNPEGRE